jgi:hypothetical protein
MAVIKSTDLDFDQIKESLKDYLRRQDEFADYDFEASGLSNILDVLAYNTHVNGLIANFAINESFLKTAQLRSSVLSHAEALGYYPKSVTGSNATVSISVATGDADALAIITLPAFTTFTAEVDDVSYSFQTLEAYTAINDGEGNYSFTTSAGLTPINIVEGSLRTKTFIIGEETEEQIFVIPDELMDTSTMVVKVYDTPSSPNYVSYVNKSQVARIDADTRVYSVREAPNGYYEVIFSNGNILGERPKAGNKIVIEYIAPTGIAANGAKVFTADDQITISGSNYSLSVTTVTNSAGGSIKESISSIKDNAPIAFAAQQRLVTAEDYKALILSNYSSVLDDVISWGGNENVPPIYGKVYVSLKYKDGISETVKTATENAIKTRLTDNLSIMSIDTVFEDPETLYLEIGTLFNFDPDLSGETVESTQSNVLALISTYFTNNLNSFGKVFRKSNLAAAVDDYSEAILDSRLIVKMNRRLVPSTTVASNYTINFPVKIAVPDDVNTIIESDTFVYSGQNCRIKNILSSTTLQLVNLSGDPLVDNIGSYNQTTGIITLENFLPESYNQFIRFTAIPASESTIKPLRNYVIAYDTVKSYARATIDYQNTEAVVL